MFTDKRLRSHSGVKHSDLDGLPGNRVQVIVTEVQLLQGQQVIEGSLMDQHQLVVVQNEVVKLRHAAEGIVAYPRQPIAADRSDREREREEEEWHNDFTTGRGSRLLEQNNVVPVEV